MKRLLLFAIPILLCANEPSAFEKQSGVTKNDIKTLQSLITSLQQRVDTIQQAQEGISSLYESQSSKLQQQIIQTTQQAKDIEELKTQSALYENLKQQVDTNTQDIQTLKAQIQEINQTLSTLNQTILNELKALSNPNPANQANKDSKPATPTIDFIKDKNKKAEIFTQAQEMFNKAEYEPAKARLEWFVEINYKKAQSHFYLGEIALKSKSYNTAIYHYKESALINDKAKYMPTLLLHSAKCFNAIKDTNNYNKLLDSLVSNYPTSKEAQEAKKLKNQHKDKK
ncbi:hypothetical protein [Helicobacter jaachi]|uniref:hypothetical protein n=1 Tax=Helicobacter jaachi TaxID=1677920 RepID=UPI00051331B7|nr:hypothetical protein [Helicobacter jaachi]